MAQKISGRLRAAFYLVFGLLAASLCARLMVGQDAQAFAPWLVGAAALIMAAVYKLLGWAQREYGALLDRLYLPVLGVFLAAYAAVQLVLAAKLRFSPIFDLGAIYDGAIQWVETGSFEQYYDYFYYFPNNLGGMAFLALVFRPLRALGIEDWFMAASTANSILLMCTMLLASLICRRQLGTGAAVGALALFGASPPFWFMGAVFYTDSLSMMFPVLCYYLYLRWRDCGSAKWRLILAGLMALAGVIGMLIKFTVLIMLVATGIDALLAWSAERPLKRAGAMIAVCAAVIALGLGAFNASIYPKHLDSERAKRQNTPYLHWVMMGLQGEGAYNGADYEFTRSFAGLDERDKALKGEIVRRAEELGPDGLYDLFWRKTCRTFGSGTYNQSDFLDDGPVEPGPLQDFLLYDGDGYGDYRDKCQVLHIAVLLLLAVSCFAGVGEAFRGKEPVPGGMAVELAVFGLMLFFACWETSGRYITNYLGVIYICAARGACCLGKLMKKPLDTGSGLSVELEQPQAGNKLKNRNR